MAGSMEVFAIIGVIAAGAIILPIVLDENPGAFLENSLCTIIFPAGPPFICNNISGNVTFTGLNGIDIYLDPLDNSTIVWEFSGNVTVNGTGVDEIHYSLGGDADVFKNETNPNVYFRGISEGDQIDVTERVNDILIDLEPCANDELLVYNSTEGGFSCVLGIRFQADVGLDIDEFFPSHLSATGGDDVVISFTDYQVRAIRERNTQDTEATWMFSIPDNYQPSQLAFEIYWFRQSTGGTEDVCHDVSVQPLEEGDDLDFTFTIDETSCSSSYGGIDILNIDYIILTPAQHGITNATDVAMFKVSRLAASETTGDNLEEDTYLLGGKMIWVD